jgi:hypothetical protein
MPFLWLLSALRHAKKNFQLQLSAAHDEHDLLNGIS